MLYVYTENNCIHEAIYSGEVMFIFRLSGFTGNVVVTFESLKFEIMSVLGDLE